MKPSNEDILWEIRSYFFILVGIIVFEMNIGNLMQMILGTIVIIFGFIVLNFSKCVYKRIGRPKK